MANIAAFGKDLTTGQARTIRTTDELTKADGTLLGSITDAKESVRLATAAALPAYTASGGPGIGRTLTANANGALTVDGIAVALNDRILVKDQAASHVDHGIYRVSQVGDGSNPFILVRASDADQNAEVTSGLYVWVNEGVTWANSGWLLITNDPIVVDTTALQFVQVNALGQIVDGDGIAKVGNILFADTALAVVEQQYGGLVKNRTGDGTGSAAANQGFLAVKTDHVDLAVGANNELKIKTNSRLDHDKGSATYAGASPVYAEWNALLPAVGDHGYLYKGPTDAVYHGFRRSTVAGDLNDFGIVEMT